MSSTSRELFGSRQIAPLSPCPYSPTPPLQRFLEPLVLTDFCLACPTLHPSDRSFQLSLLCLQFCSSYFGIHHTFIRTISNFRNVPQKRSRQYGTKTYKHHEKIPIKLMTIVTIPQRTRSNKRISWMDSMVMCCGVVGSKCNRDCCVDHETEVRGNKK